MPATYRFRYRDEASLAHVAAQAKSYATGAVHFLHVAEEYERTVYEEDVDRAFYHARARELRQRSEEEARCAITLARDAGRDLEPY